MVYVFGGSGFVGKHLIKALTEKNYQIVSCDLNQTNEDDCNIKIDIMDESSLSAINFNKNDVVVNLIARQYHETVPKKNRDDYFMSVNAIAVRNILKRMNECGCNHLVQYTTDMVYGKPQYLPIDIDHPLNPFGPYGKSKIEAERICREYREKGFNITIFRPRMIMGPGRLGILKKLFVLIDHNLPVPTVGNGKNCYQMISVFDCVSATIAAIEKGCPNSL